MLMLLNSIVGMLYACSWMAPAVGNVMAFGMLMGLELTKAQLDTSSTFPAKVFRSHVHIVLRDGSRHNTADHLELLQP